MCIYFLIPLYSLFKESNMETTFAQNLKTIFITVNNHAMKFLKIGIIIAHTIFCFFIVTNLMPLVQVCSNIKYFNNRNYTDINYRSILSETLNVCMNQNSTNMYSHIQKKYWVLINYTGCITSLAI